jgi:hypothetical protein
MSTYMVEIIRDSLAGFEQRVREEEAGASEFSGNQISALDNQLANLASFRPLPAGQRLNPPSFVEIGAMPAGEVPAWTGVVMIGATNLAVSMFRRAQGEKS